MKRLFIGLLLVCGMAFGCSANAADPSQLKVGTAGAEDFLKVLEQSSDASAKRVFEATKRQEPRFIFVPGMFGSRLTLDNDDGSRSDIWGGDTNAFATGPLRYDHSQKVETGPLNSLDFIATHQDIYGEALSNLASHSVDSKMLSVFSYDWRQDNSVSAAELQKYLCDNRAVFAGHKTYIIAHSMGGLIVKYWYKNFRNLDCVTTKETNNSGWLRVAGIILVGTPLYGAPATIAAFGGKFSLLPGGDTPFIGGIIQGFDRSTVSKELIENGAMFESAYELLPDYMEECVGAKADLAPLKLRANDSSVSNIGSLFLPETWRNLGWPVQLPTYETRTEFYDVFLPTALSKALDFSCQVATYDLVD